MSVIIVEHKTTSEDISVGSDYWKRLRLDSQVSNYHIGAKSMGLDVTECLYDVIRKPGISPCSIPIVEDGAKVVLDANGERVRTKDKKKWRETGEAELGYVLQSRKETAEEYRLRLREDICNRPDRYYGRGRIVRLDFDEVDAMHDTWGVAKQIRESELSGRWPRNSDACVRYGRTCDFFPVCARDTTLDNERLFRKKYSEHSELADDDAIPGRKKLPLVTTSSMKAYRRCAREYQIEYVLRYTTPDKADALRFGTLFHGGLEVWWTTADLDKTLAAVVGAVDEYEQAKAEELLRGYHFRWIGEPLRVLAVEKQFRAPLINPATGGESKTYQLGGKIDAIASYETEEGYIQ